MNGPIVGLIELVVGGIGVGAGWTGRLSRPSMITALGLALLGLSHYISGGYLSYLPDAGGAIILLGLGMTLGILRRGRRSRDGQNSDPSGS